MNQFVELKVTVQDKKGIIKKISRMVNINEVLSISQGPTGKCIVFTKEHIQPTQPKHSKNKAVPFPRYLYAIVMPTTVDNDYNDLRRELTGKSIIDDPDLRKQLQGPRHAIKPVKIN